MGLGTACVLIVLIICITILAGVYMYYCGENNIGIFKDPEYEKCIKEMKKAIENLKEEKKK